MRMAVMFITHDMGVVAEVADRLVVMYRGEKVEEGPTERIFATPSQRYTKALLSAVPRLGSLKDEDYPRKFPLVMMDGGRAPDLESTMVSRPPSARAPLLKVRDLTTRFDVKSGFFGRVRRRVHA